MAANTVTRCRPLLGTFVEITVPETHAGSVDAAFARMAHVHAHMSFHEGISDLAAMRNAAPGQVIAIDPDTVEVLRIAQTLHAATGGLFDVAIAHRLVESGFLPREGIGPLRHYDGTMNDIVILDDSHVQLDRPVLIDLGGIAKGFAVDRAVEALTDAHVPFGLVNAGGDLLGFGSVDWVIGLRDADNVIRSHVTIRDCALASSANLLNRRSLRGEPYSPHIGWHGQSVLAETRTTVMAETCVIADAMTKIAMIAPDLAGSILRTHGGHVLCEPQLAGAA